MDSTGEPMAYEIFPGNESEKLSMRPLFKKVKAFFGIQRTIMVADRGLNTSNNIDFIAGKNDRNPGEKTDFDGYVLGQSIVTGSDEFKKRTIFPKYAKKQRKDRDKAIEKANIQELHHMETPPMLNILALVRKQEKLPTIKIWSLI